MGNIYSTFVDIAFGPTEDQAKMSLISTIKARYPKVTKIEILDENNRPTQIMNVKKILILPYGTYQLEVIPISSEYMASLSFIDYLSEISTFTEDKNSNLD